ncbi:hypothetical protein Pan258_29990 [Symmachiella dynata]|uniref:DUF5682 family protein n=1 Tax=Symmachiella dynata TaxID=2527995 RepID=UPI001188EBCF|nr:DUF5682 family protein [Symmachiella dynata]QDT48952.1 hypothetical protein Pan258_29990 [Symmachiella dynata]
MAKASPTKTPRDQVAEEVASIAERAQAILDEPWYWFPVRHHSAAVAKLLETAIRTRRPRRIFVEGPSDANHLIPFLASRQTRPPVAIYSCFSDDDNSFQLAGIASPSEDIPPRWACWYPFIDYSPELVAIRTAQEIGTEVRFFDLPHYGRLDREVQQLLHESDERGEEDDKSDSNAIDESGSRNWHTEKLIAESDFYQSLAAAGGYKSWDEGWDTLFEFRAFADPEEYRREMLAFCGAARLSCAAQRIAEDGTLDRERFMLNFIRQEIAESGIRDDEVMIVCGGFHAFLNRDDPEPPPTIPSGTRYTTVVPYSTFRIADLSGYGAGNRAPQFYQLHWESLSGNEPHPRNRYVVSVLQEARNMGEPLSAADAISVAQHARMLAALRGRDVPILDDLHDALFTCCCKGDPHEQGARLGRAIDAVNIGNRVGKVMSGVPRLPIVDDFYNQIERLELGRLVAREKRERLELDKRQIADFQTAAFFHRLRFIEIPFCQMEATPQSDFDTGLIFRERWQTKWSPDVEAKLIEKNLLGDSIDAAAVNQMREIIAENHGQSGVICGILVDGTKMDLPHLVDQVVELAVNAIDEDPRFESLCRAVAELSVLDRYAVHQAIKREQIARMLNRAFTRACFAMIDIIAAPDDHFPHIVNGLTTLAEIVVKGDDPVQRQLFAHYVASASRETTVPFLKGALLGLAVEIQIEPQQTITDEILAYARSSQDKMALAGDFVHGVISVSRVSIMGGSSSLVDALDVLVRAAEWDAFIVMLPRLRAAMELLHAHHRDSLATRVAELYGLAEARTLQKLSISVGEAADIVRIDREVAEIMQRWSIIDE